MVRPAVWTGVGLECYGSDASGLLAIAGIKKEHEAAVRYQFCHFRHELLRGDNLDFGIVTEIGLQLNGRDYSGGIVSPQPIANPDDQDLSQLDIP